MLARSPRGSTPSRDDGSWTKRRRSRAARAALSLVPLSAEVPAYGGDVARALRLALETLPEAQRQVIVLKLLAGRTFAEIAELVGTTEAASRMRFSRGLELLRDELEREGMSP